MKCGSAILGFFVALGMCSGARADYPTFHLSIAVAKAADGTPVVDRAWIDERVARANELFRDDGVSFDVRDVVTRDDRDALATRLHAHVINIFIVRTLNDVDEDGVLRMGVHWHVGAQHYVILSTRAAAGTLAHELGHFFGNAHSPTCNNVMSYCREGNAPTFFDDGQHRRIRALAAKFRRTHELML